MSRQIDPSGSISALFGRFPDPESGIQSEIYLQQHMLITRQLLPMGLINILASLLVATAMAPKVGWMVAAAWATPIVLSGFLQLWSWSRFRGAPAPEKVSGSFLRKGEYIALFAGICWGSCVFVFGQNGNNEELLFLNMMQAGMTAGVVSLMTPLPRHTSRFVIPVLLPAALSPLFVTSAFSIATAVLGIVYCMALVSSSIDSYRQLKATITKTFESQNARNNLIDAIESTNDAFAFFDRGGHLALKNARHVSLFGENASLRAMGGSSEGVETIKQGARWLQRSRHRTGQGGVVVVSTDITDLKGRERELLEARREAVEADEAKSRFLSTMSHELRTPLNIILGFSRLMASDSQVQLSESDIREYSDSINESGAHLLRLINDIIDYSTLGLDRFMLDTAEVDLRELLARTVALAANFENVRDLSAIDISVSPRIGKLRVDERVCQRIIMNLLSNAFRYRGADERLVVRAGLDTEGRPFIAIRDFGNGIPTEEQARVFEAFYQSKSGLDGAQGGTGLGLTLCRHLAQLHDGDVILKSRIGVGTTATLVLPASTYIAQKDTSVPVSPTAKVA